MEAHSVEDADGHGQRHKQDDEQLLHHLGQQVGDGAVQPVAALPATEDTVKPVLLACQRFSLLRPVYYALRTAMPEPRLSESCFRSIEAKSQAQPCDPGMCGNRVMEEQGCNRRALV